MKAKYKDLFGNIKEEKVETEKQIICALENPECIEICDKNYSLRKNGALYELGYRCDILISYRKEV